MDYIFRWLRSYLTCCLYGGDLERLLSMCKAHNIYLWNMTFDGNLCMCSMYVDDFWKLRRFIKKTHMKIRINKRHGFKFLTKQMYQRKYYIFGLLSFLVMISFLTSRIWKIEVYGNSHYTETTIKSYLDEMEQISYGTPKNQLNTKNIDENLRVQFKDIAWVSTEVIGTSLIVQMEETEGQNLQEHPFVGQNIYSDIEGTIVSMVTRSGTPVVTIGENVKIGDLLINAYIPVYDDSFTVVGEQFAGADGDIGIQTTETYYKRYDYPISTKKFDRSRFRIHLHFGKHTISFGKKVNTEDLSQFCHMTEYYPFNNEVALSVDIYRPYETVHALTSISEAKTLAQKELSERLHEFNEKGVQILENNVRIIMYGDYLEASGSLVIVCPAGVQKDLPMNHTQNSKNGETYEYNGNDD